MKAIRDDIAKAQAAAATEAVAPPHIGEVASSRDGRDITAGYLDKIRPHQDRILNARGAGLELYEEVLRDPQAFSCFQQRRLAVVSKEWAVMAGAEDKQSKMAADFLKEQLENIPFDRATNNMLNGLWYGYAVAEVMWGYDGKNVVIDKIKVKKQRRFRFDTDDKLRLLTRDAPVEGELVPDRKFWTFTAGADNDDDPYGLGLGHYCYWPVWFKKNGLRFWSMFLDKFGAPTGVGKFPPGTSEGDQRKLLAAVAAIQSDSGIIIPDGMLIEMLEAKRSGSSDNKSFHDTMDASIAKIILSQTMTTDSKATGLGSSQGEVQRDVKQEVVEADADLVCSTFNDQPVRWLTEWNFPGAIPPKVWREIEPPEDLDKRAERDTKVYKLGFEPSEEYVRDTYGDGWTKKEGAPPPVLPGLPGGPPLSVKDNEKDAAFAEVATPAIKDATDRLVDQALNVGEAVLDAFIDEIRKLLTESDDLVEFQRLLLERYPEFDVSDVAALIRDAMLVSQLTGRVDIDDRK